MESFEISKLTPELKNEIRSCKNTEELKALFVSKNYYVPDNKLDSVLQLCARLPELSPDELEMVSGGINSENLFCNCS